MPHAKIEEQTQKHKGILPDREGDWGIDRLSKLLILFPPLYSEWPHRSQSLGQMHQKGDAYAVFGASEGARTFTQRLSAKRVSTGRTPAALRPAWDAKTTSLPAGESKSKSENCGF
jgi:hypothetical protein